MYFEKLIGRLRPGDHSIKLFTSNCSWSSQMLWIKWSMVTSSAYPNTHASNIPRGKRVITPNYLKPTAQKMIVSFASGPIHVLHHRHYFCTCWDSPYEFQSVTLDWSLPDNLIKFLLTLLKQGFLSQLIHIDKCGFNKWTGRNQGWSAWGCWAVRNVEGEDGQNFTACL